MTPDNIEPRDTSCGEGSYSAERASEGTRSLPSGEAGATLEARERVARIVDPTAEWDRKPCGRFWGTKVKHAWDQFYVWDSKHSGIVNPDGPTSRTYPWRVMDTPEKSLEAAAALNAREDAWWKARQADALSKADAILAALQSSAAPSNGTGRDPSPLTSSPSEQKDPTQ